MHRLRSEREPGKRRYWRQECGLRLLRRMGGGLWPRGGKERETRLYMARRTRDVRKTRKVVLVHGCVEPAKRHQMILLTSGRNPVRAREEPRPA